MLFIIWLKVNVLSSRCHRVAISSKPIKIPNNSYIFSKGGFMFRKILGPSPILYGIKKVHSHLFIRGGSENDLCLSDEAFFEIMTEPVNS